MTPVRLRLAPTRRRRFPLLRRHSRGLELWQVTALMRGWRPPAGEHQLMDLRDLGRAFAAARRSLTELPELNEMPARLRDRLNLNRFSWEEARPLFVDLAERRARQGPLGAVPRWVLIAAAAAGIAIGIGAGVSLTRQRAATQRAMRELEAASARIKATWPDLSDDDIRRARGNADRLAETIRLRTGEEIESVRGRLVELTASAASVNGTGSESH